jgi:hypothetical protein
VVSEVARVGLVTGLLVAGLAAGELTHVAAERAPAPQPVPVVGASAVCPDGPVAAGAAGAGAGELVVLTPTAVGPGRDGARAAPGAPVLDRAGTAVRDLAASAVTATEAVAAGLAVEHVRWVDDGTARGVEALPCTAPTTSTWFVGGATTVGQTSELVLVNPDPTPAVVDVRTWSATGPVEPRPGRALRVPAAGRLAVPMDRLAPDRDLLAVHVASSRGRVAASLRHVRADGRTPRGVAQVPTAGEPSRDMVVPGLPAGPGRRAVVVANPAGHDARVQLQLTTADGQLAPVELAVPAGTAVAHEVTDELAGTPAAARVVSPDGPVLAAALVEDGTGAERDLAWAGAAGPVTGAALLLHPPAPVGERALLLTALERDSVVDLVPLAAPGGAALPGGRRVRVPAATTVELDLTGLGTGPALELRPVRGRVHAARVLGAGARPGVAVLAVLSPPRAVLRPAVVADPLLERARG